MVLRVENLSVSFKTARGLLKALRQVNFHIGGQQIVGLVGESGCGKSTVINSILNLLSDNALIEEGRICLQDEDILTMTPQQLRSVRGQRISVIFQDPMTSLNPVLSIGRQMTDIQYRDKLSASEKKKRIIRMLGRVGIPDPEKRLDSFPHQFSGGMRQRIAIAMALMMKPELLIADEPTTALDATLQIQIIDLLKALQKDIECSILFVSHDLGLIADFCDQVIVMYAGEMVESGSVRDIFHRGAHPYTNRLLECDPARIKEKTRVLPTIPGEIPDLVELDGNCIFVDRCPIKEKGCPLTWPPQEELSPGHFVRCHLNRLGRNQ
ncbi:ABC transporter ATP-binding protein [Desulfospira joergensenii]|uniref:ABC transporter ATP-binding protein n=1 Tax=Desulfospira joergensenii TaxID=53329 RepID=UPI0003B48729|nr:ABC transporter ATP-binding protein [Desulfospira joergensenii]